MNMNENIKENNYFVNDGIKSELRLDTYAKNNSDTDEERDAIDEDLALVLAEQKNKDKSQALKVRL